MAETPAKEQSGLLSNILAVAGLVILLGILIWGTTHLAALSGSWFSSFSFSSPSSSKTIKVTVPTKKISSGEQFSVSWKYNPRNVGTYALLYQCKEGFQFKATVAGNTPVAIPCGIGYTMLAENNKFDVIPLLSGTSSVDVQLSIIFMSSAATATGTPSQVRGNAKVTIIHSTSTLPQAAENTPVEKTSMLQTVETPSTNATDSPNLSVRILSKGVIDPIGGNIISREPTSPNDLVSVRFLISNDGGTSTGPWYFTAKLPTSPNYPYTSPAQAPLKAGGKIENMLRFKNAIPGGVFSVTVDPVNEVKESDEGNNSASTSI